MNYVREQLACLEFLYSLDAQQRAQAISLVREQVIHAVCEAIANVINYSRFSADDKDSLKKVLSPYKEEIRTLADSKISQSRRVKHLTRIQGRPLELILKSAIALYREHLASKEKREEKKDASV